MIKRVIKQTPEAEKYMVEEYSCDGPECEVVGYHNLRYLAWERGPREDGVSITPVAIVSAG